MSGYLQLQFSAKNDLCHMTREHYMGSRGASIQSYSSSRLGHASYYSQSVTKVMQYVSLKMKCHGVQHFYANSDKKVEGRVEELISTSKKIFI